MWRGGCTRLAAVFGKKNFSEFFRGDFFQTHLHERAHDIAHHKS